MPFGSASPPYSTRHKEQTELTSLTDEEFKSIREDPVYTWYMKAFKVFCFIVFLGPLRIICGIIGFGICGAIVNGIMWIDMHVFNNYNLEAVKKFCRKIGRLGFYFINFGMGIVYYNVKGTFDPEARFFISNHTALIDPFVFMIFAYYTPVIKIEVHQVKFLNIILEDVVNCVYVERDKHKGQAQTIVDRANNSLCDPVLIYPEGTISGGDFMLKFHKTPFLTEYKVQPVAMRYVSPLVPNGWNMYGWKKATLWQHLWNMLSMPPSYVTLDILPAMTKAVDGEGDPEKFAAKAELAIANHLGLRATDRSSHEIYLVKSQEKAAAKAKTE